jgi:hypothetical protein
MALTAGDKLLPLSRQGDPFLNLNNLSKNISEGVAYYMPPELQGKRGPNAVIFK